MRIVGGEYRGKIIRTPKNLPVRPTTDFAKEALFNILHHRIEIEGKSLLDLFAGTGNISYEFISRGISKCVCVDISKNNISFIKKICAELDFKTMQVIKSNVFSLLQNNKGFSFDLIFADPPYDIDRIDAIPRLIFENNWLNKGGVLIMEHPDQVDFSKEPNFVEHRQYGKVNFSLFEY